MIQHAYILLLALAAASCCGGRTATDDPAPFIGRVVIIGNEPFTSPAVQAADGEIYRLTCTKETEAALREAQGKRVRLECTRVDRAAKKLHVTQVVVLIEEPTKGTP